MNKTSYRRFLVAFVVIGIGSALDVPAAAAQGAAEGIEEVVVTARKRTETLQDVPIAITAFTADQIDAAGLRSLEDVSLFTPGLQFSQQADQNPARLDTSIRFRGMYINDINPTQQLASAFIDGIYVSGGVTGIGFEDVERVEVIKGPQSALFGRSTFGGAVNFVTRTPGEEFSGKVSGLAASHATYDISGSVEGGLIEDVLSGRVTVRSFATDGAHRSSVDRGLMGEQTTDSVYLTLFATPVDQLEAKLRLTYHRDEDGAPSGFLMGTEPTGTDLRNCFDQTGGPTFPGQRNYFCGAIPVIPSGQFGTNTFVAEGWRDYIYNDTPFRPVSGLVELDHLGLKRTVRRATLGVDYTLPSGHTITSNSGYSKEIVDHIRDGDWDEATFIFTLHGREYEDYSQEFRIASPAEGRLRWMAGANLFGLKYEEAIASRIPFTPTFIFISEGAILEEEVTTTGLFASVDYDITDVWSLHAEARYQWDETDQGQSTTGEAFKKTFKKFLPRVILQYQPDERTNLFLTYARGNKPGTFNVNFADLTPSQQAEVRAQIGAGDFVPEETLDNYELGWKQLFWDDRANISLAAYWMEWQNQKTRVPAVYTQNGNPRVGTFLVSAGQTDLWGLEFESTVQPTDNWQVGVNINYAAAEYQEFRCDFVAPIQGSNDCAGNETPRFPELSGSVNTTYNFPFRGAWEGYVRADALYFGKAYADVANLAWADAYWRFDARLGLQGDGTRLEFFVRNLFDDDSLVAAARLSDFTGSLIVPFDFSQQGVMVTPNDGRIIGVRAIWEF